VWSEPGSRAISALARLLTARTWEDQGAGNLGCPAANIVYADVKGKISVAAAAPRSAKLGRAQRPCRETGRYEWAGFHGKDVPPAVQSDRGVSAKRNELASGYPNEQNRIASEWTDWIAYRSHQ
jgi:acyl-homoserine lactone acylase PvdQ